jgi:hypothetical protein
VLTALSRFDKLTTLSWPKGLSKGSPSVERGRLWKWVIIGRKARFCLFDQATTRRLPLIDDFTSYSLLQQGKND